MTPAPRILSPKVFFPLAVSLAPLLPWLAVAAIARGLEALAYGTGTLLALLLLARAPLHIAFTLALAVSVCARLLQHLRWPPSDSGDDDGPRYA